MIKCLPWSLSACISLAATTQLFGGTFTNDFNNGVPPGAAVYGNAVVESSGGVANSGALKLTKAVGGQSSAFILEDLDAGAPIYGFDMNFKARIDGGGTPADGFSISFAPDLPQAGFGEGGAGTGLTITFDIYINNPPETSRSIQAKIGGAVVASKNLTLEEITTGTNFVDVHVRLNPNGALDLTYKGQTIFTNLFLPNYQAIQGQFGFGGRTGGAFANQFIDDLGITTFLQPEVGISLPPRDMKVLAGTDVIYHTEITNPDGATFQWFKNGTAIAGATSADYTVPGVTLADSGSKYSLRVTGPNNTATSQEATLTVKDISLPATAQFSANFNDGTTPPEALLSGFAAVSPTGGVADSGVVQVTFDQLGAQGGGLIVSDLSAGAPVYGVTAEFDVLARSLDTPADGFSFSFGSDIPDDLTTVEAENGIGSGLSVGFDIYDNGNAEAPSIDIFYNHALIASAKVPLSFIMTGDAYAHAIVRLSNDGTVDVVYKNEIIHEKVPVPGFTSISAGRYVLAARTGGSDADQWFDNLEITPELSAGNLFFATEPTAQTVLSGKTATFSALVNDPAGVTFQWFKNGTAIPGATSSSYTTPATTTADNGALFKVQATKEDFVVSSEEVVLNVVDLAVPTAPNISLNFEDGQIPAGTHIYGTGTGLSGLPWMPVAQAGSLELTEASNGEAGAFVIDPILGGAELSGISVAFDLLIGGGTTPPADGFSFDFAPDLPAAASGAAEDGLGTGLSLGFDIYDNGGGEAPAVELKYKGVLLASRHLTTDEIQTGDSFRKVLLRVAADGTMDVSYGDLVLFTAVKPTNYTFISNGKFGFYARTGGFNANQWIDNVQIQGTKSTAPLRIVAEPQDVLVMPGQTATLSVSLSDPNGAVYQWSRNGTAIAGATSATYTTPALALSDSGATFTVSATGPGGTATSRAAVITVAEPITISNPTFSYDFETGLPPDGSSLNGANSAVIATGLTNGMVLQLTEAVGSENGALVIPDINNGEPVSGLTVHFQLHIGNGSGTPADGFGFVWADDLPLTANFAENGAGSGLTIGFDTYQNTGEQSPAIQISYKGTVLVRKVVPYSFLATGEGFADFYLRVEPDGTLDLQYKNTAIVNNLPLPGFTPVTAGSFGFGAHTGGEWEEHWVDNIQISTSTGAAPAQLSLTRGGANGQLVLSWTGTGTLQARDSLSPGSAWAAVPNATNPYVVPNTQAMRFFRVAQ